jgi:hypothetical protein
VARGVALFLLSGGDGVAIGSEEETPGPRAVLDECSEVLVGVLLAQKVERQPSGIDRRRVGQLAKDYARATVRLTMAYAGMIMRAAYASGRIGRDPTTGLRAPKVRAGDPDGVVGPDEVPTRSGPGHPYRRPELVPGGGGARPCWVAG